MGALDGRVAVITGASRGIGREHALLFAREGARVVVNDLDGVDDVVAETGGTGIAADISSWEGAESVVRKAVDTFGRLDVLVNNAGILRDAYIASTDESQWDSVIAVHLKGHFAMLHHAAVHWKERSKAGEQVRGSVINTASASGTILPNAGQANYGAAKAGIAAMTLVAAQELVRYGVRANAIAPIARTRLTLATPGFEALFAEPEDKEAFDPFHPSHVSPLVAYLATETCPVNGKVFAVQGGVIQELAGWHTKNTTETDKPWTIEEIAQRLTDW
ncbi:SDR family NAD(P)-dependent oxidoreductase [Actinocrispum sp. NPDC049592]|uniref:SDR family NAD(P)-dependent oxidoreductase n=1 Tax=Actinocrispum sp. NPDC049592 TaxID=3154835 RepID=UPI0034496AF6